jgi:predicted nucleic acid-binding Zn ribbon protein
MGRPRRIYSMKETLEQFLAKNSDLQYKIKSQEALTAWERVIDPYVNEHAKTSLIKDGILFVNTDSSALANELSLREEMLRGDLNAALKTPVVKKIVFKSGFIKKANKVKTIKKINNRKITLKTLNLIDETIRQVDEDELRFILRKFLISAAMRNKEQ